jgi:hypothetical protein
LLAGDSAPSSTRFAGSRALFRGQRRTFLRWLAGDGAPLLRSLAHLPIAWALHKPAQKNNLRLHQTFAKPWLKLDETKTPH